MPQYKSFARKRVVPSKADPIPDLPETVAEFVDLALSNPPTPPPPPKPPKSDRKRSAGAWDGMTKKERSAYAKALAAKRNPKNMARPHKAPRGPRGWNADDARKAKANALIQAQSMVAKLIDEGAIARDDLEGQKATVNALARLNTPGGPRREKTRAARRLIAHYGSGATTGGATHA